MGQQPNAFDSLIPSGGTTTPQDTSGNAFADLIPKPGQSVSPSGKLGPVPRNRYSAQILKAANTHNVDPALLTALVQQESGFRQFGADGKTPLLGAPTKYGQAVGLGQLLPSTAK